MQVELQRQKTSRVLADEVKAPGQGGTQVCMQSTVKGIEVLFLTKSISKAAPARALIPDGGCIADFKVYATLNGCLQEGWLQAEWQPLAEIKGDDVHLHRCTCLHARDCREARQHASVSCPQINLAVNPCSSFYKGTIPLPYRGFNDGKSPVFVLR